MFPSIRAARLLALATCELASAMVPAAGLAQEAGARVGAHVLSMPAGSRAPGLAGAMTADHEGADVLFYNPAGGAVLQAAVTAAYQSHVVDITYVGGAGAYRIGRVVIGASAAFLDFGRIDVLVPDPNFGGQTGRRTGNTATAAEATGRLVLAAPLLAGKLRVGVAGGFVTTRIAEEARSSAVFDAGAQVDAGPIALGLALRNVGPDLKGHTLADTPLPSEARLGLQYRWRRSDGLGATAGADAIHRFGADETALAAGIEAGLLPSSTGIGAVARLGWSGAGGDIGRLRLGGGVSVGRFALDYTHQDFDAFGGVHRFGLRWSGPR